MSQSSRKHRKKMALLFVVALILIIPSTKAGDWTVVRQHDRSYVTLANLARFYQFSEYTRVNGSVSLRSERRVISAQPGTCDLSINGLRFFSNFPLVRNGEDDLVSVVDLNKIIEPVLRPSRIPSSERVETIVLDPGHGGPDSGATSEWGMEKDLALDVALAAKKDLIQSGYRVEMTRSGDVAVALEDRVAFANGFPKAVFVSIHFNFNWSGSGVGIESYALAPEGVPSNASSEHYASATSTQRCTGNALDAQNIALSAAVHASVLSRLSLIDRGVRHARFHVLRNIRVPAVLLEGGFISNPSEGQRIATIDYRQQLGTAIAQGIRNYDAALNYKATKKITFANTRARPNLSANSRPPVDEPPASQSLKPIPGPVDPREQ